MEEEWGPWESRFPGLELPRKAEKYRGKGQVREKKRQLPLRIGLIPEPKVPSPVKTLGVLSYFNSTFAAEPPVRVKKRSQLLVLSSLSPPQDVGPRSQSVTRGQDSSGKRVGTNSSPTRVLIRSQHRAIQPFSLSIRLGEQAQIGQKVLAGPLLPLRGRESPVLEALERRISRILVKGHQHRFPSYDMS